MSCRSLFWRLVWAQLLLFPVFNAGAQLQRAANTTLTMPESMPTVGYTSSNAFPNLSFTNPVCIASPPGETNRLFIVGKNGVIYVITNMAAPTETIFMDISSRVTSTTSNSGDTGEQGLLSLAFDPGYATNHYFYVFYTGQATNGTTTNALHHFLSRFSFTAGNTNQGNPNSETPLYIQYKRWSNHNGGDLMFGPDGYLYVSVGDEGMEYDYYTNAQHITWRLWSGILRLDVDKIDPLGLPPNTNSDLSNIFSKTTNYDIPHDNPFVGATNYDGQPINAGHVQTEFWATGLRNPWRMCFDPATGNLFCADVGQDQYEEADIITKGGNYGWSWWEGTNTPPSGVSAATLAATPYPSNAISPFVTYAHASTPTTGNAIIGGVVYRGQHLPQLYGDYVFGDYVDGNVWAIPAAQAVSLTATNGAITPPNAILTDNSGISAFGVDPRNGDVLYTAMNSSSIKRIIYNTTTNGAPLPPTLYDTGAFTNLLSLTNSQQTLLPAAGIVPYTINVPFWSDNAIKSRWFSVPNTNLTIGFNPNGNWSFPTGMVFIKNFNLELTNGDPTSEIRLETRFIVVNSAGVYGVTYIWNSQTNAILAPAPGWDTNLVVNNGGILQTQDWHFPSQSECLTCHTSAGGYGLGFRTEQLNDLQDYGLGPTNEIQALSAAGYFTSPVTNDPSTLLALAASTNTAYSLEFRARSFLMANCSQCHQPAGTAQQSLWDARITTPTELAGLINGPVVNNLGNTNNHLVVPLAPANSVLFIRDAARDLGANPSIQMPPLDSNLADSDATNLITAWILGLTNMFWLGGTPNQATVVVGNNAVYTIDFLATTDFVSGATLSVSNLPAGMSAGFNPATVNQTTTNSTMTITTSGTTPGTYVLTIAGAGGNVTNSTTVSLVVISPPVTGYWTNNVSSTAQNWNVNANWTNTTTFPQNSGDAAIVNAGLAAPQTINLNQAIDISALQIGDANGVASYTIAANGGSLTFAGANTSVITQLSPSQGDVLAAPISITNNLVVTNNSPHPLVLAGTLSGAGNAALTISSGALQVGNAANNGGLGSVNVTDNGSLIFDSPGNIVISGVISGRGSLTNNGSGTVTLAAVETFTGATVVNAGTLALDGGNSGNSGLYENSAIIVNNGGTISVVIDNSLMGHNNNPVPVIINAGGTLTGPASADNGEGSNSHIKGLLTLNGGTLSMNGNYTASLAYGNWDLDGGVAVGNPPSSTTSVISCLADPSQSGGTVFNVADGGTPSGIDLLVSGILIHGTSDGDTGIIKTGNGTMTLAGTNTYLDNTYVNGGTLALIGSGNINTSTNVAVNGATLNLSGLTAFVCANTQFSLTNATLALAIPGKAVTNETTTTLNLGGATNHISITSVPFISSFPQTFHLIRYATLAGTFNAGLNSLPSGVAGYVTNENNFVDLVITAAPTTRPRVVSTAINGNNFIFSGANGVPGWPYWVLSSSNLDRPVAGWTLVSTNSFDAFGNFIFTNPIGTNVQLFYLLEVP